MHSSSEPRPTVVILVNTAHGEAQLDAAYASEDLAATALGRMVLTGETSSADWEAETVPTPGYRLVPEDQPDPAELAEQLEDEQRCFDDYRGRLGAALGMLGASMAELIDRADQLAVAARQQSMAQGLAIDQRDAGDRAALLRVAGFLGWSAEPADSVTWRAVQAAVERLVEFRAACVGDDPERLQLDQEALTRTARYLAGSGGDMVTDAEWSRLDGVAQARYMASADAAVRAYLDPAVDRG